VPIIPTDGTSVPQSFLEILDVFDPDCLFYYQPDGHDLEDSNPEKFEELLQQQVRRLSGDEEDEPDAGRSERMRKTLRHSSIGRFSISDELKTELANWTNPFDPRHDNTLSLTRVRGRNARIRTHLTEILDVATVEDCRGIGSFDYSELPSSLTLLAGAVLGIASQKTREKLQNLISDDAQVKVNLENLDQLLDQVWQPLPNPFTEANHLKPLHNLTNLNCAMAYRSSLRRHAEPVAVVCGDTVQDFCLYQSLRSVKRHTYWMPDFLYGDGKNGDVSGALRRVQWRLGNVVLDDFQQRQSDEIAFISESLAGDQLRSMPERLEQGQLVISSTQESVKERAVYPQSVHELLQNRFEIFEKGNVDHRGILQFDKGRSIERIPTPKPKHFDNLTLSSPSWITDVEIENYDLPTRPKLAPDTLKEDWYDTNWVRVTTGGFSYYCPNHTFLGGRTLDQILARPEVHLKAPLGLFEDIFGEAGYTIQPSDKGNYQIQAFSRVGGFESLCEIVCQRSARDVFYEYVEERPRSSPDGSVVVLGDRSYLSFEGIAEASGSEDTATSLIDQFTQLSVIRRGLILQCQYCRKAGWYGLSGLSQQFECRRCHEKQFIQRDAWKKPDRGPTWYYQLDEIMYQFFHHNNHVSLLALNAIKKQNDSFMHAPEVELRREPSANAPDKEIDICAIADGEVVLGEATIGTKKTKDDLDGYLRLAEEVGAKQVVFATMEEDWSDEYKGYGNETFGEARADLRFMAYEDLLSDPGKT